MNDNTNKINDIEININKNKNDFNYSNEYIEDFKDNNNNYNKNNTNEDEKKNINNKELNNILERFEKIENFKQNIFQTFEYYTHKSILILFLFFILLEIFFIIIIIISKTALYFKIITIVIAALIVIFLFIPYGINLTFNSINKFILIHKKCILNYFCNFSCFNEFLNLRNIKIFILQKTEGCCILKYEILFTLKTSPKQHKLCSIQREFCQKENFDKILLQNIEQMNKWIYM